MSLYLLIFIVKIVEISMMTVRTVLMTRGEKLYAALLGFVEISIWIYLVGQVLTGIQDDPLRMLAYALGFACGIYVGSILEDWLGVGLVTIHVTVSVSDGVLIARKLRESGAGVTNLKGEGRDEGKSVLLVHVKRRKRRQMLELIRSVNPEALVNVYDVKNVSGGFGLKK